MSENNEVDVTLGFGGEVVGKAVVNEDGTVEASLTDEGARKVFPDWDPTEGLSIAEFPAVDLNAYTEAYFAQNPDATRSYEEAYYRNRPKGTFDA